MTIRMNINLSDETGEKVRHLAKAKGVTATELIRYAVSVYAFLSEEQEAGRRISTGRGEERAEVIFL